MKNEKKCTAIVLSAGTGSRMGGPVAKQYMLLADKPVLWYSLNVIEQSKVIDDCILVTGANDIDYVTREIVQKFGFTKVHSVVAGGTERYLSVMNALKAMEEGAGYVFIHDGARPFLSEEMLTRLADAVDEYHACVAAMPSKDTVKIVDRDNWAIQTPDRRTVWNVQTPQVFDARIIIEAYERLEMGMQRLHEQGIAITDDAGVVELFTNYKVRLVEGSYHNIKITTPEDMVVATALLKEI